MRIPKPHLVKVAAERLGVYRLLLRVRPLRDVAVLCYHGITVDETPGQSELHVTAERFDEHCRVLRELCTPISLAEFGAIASGQASAPPAPIVLTFDDGYRNMLTMALPILERWAIPAAVFVCPDVIASERLHWFDAIAEDRDEAIARVRDGSEAGWRAAYAQLRRQFDPDHPLAVLSRSELQQLARHPLITVGAHTLRHPSLATLARASQEDEIATSRAVLAEWLGQPPAWFAYPFGESPRDFTSDTEELVRAAGYTDAFMVGETYTRPGAMRWRQRRICMTQSTTGSELAHRLAVSYPRHVE